MIIAKMTMMIVMMTMMTMATFMITMTMIPSCSASPSNYPDHQYDGHTMIMIRMVLIYNDSDDDNFNDKTMVRDIAKGCIYRKSWFT